MVRRMDGTNQDALQVSSFVVHGLRAVDWCLERVKDS